jgi:hypothetical protein
MLPPQPARGFDSLEQAVEQLASRLYLAEGSDKKARLVSILQGRLEEIDRTWRIRGAQSLQPGLVSWRPQQLCS